MNEESSPAGSGVASGMAMSLSRKTRAAFNALSLAALGLAVFLPVLVTGYWLTDGSLVISDASLRMVAVATALLHLLPLSWGLIRLRACLAMFAAGQPFDADGIAGLRDFALGTGLSALAKPLAGMLFVLAVSWGSGPRQIAIDISSDAMILAVFSGVVAALAWAMRKAALLAEENSQFV